MERNARDPFHDQREHDIAAVAVGEPLPGSERLRVSGQDIEIILGVGQFVHGHGLGGVNS